MNCNAVINSCYAKYNLLHSHEIELERKKISQLATLWYCNHTTHCSIVATVTSSLFAMSNKLLWTVIVGRVKVIVIVRCSRLSVQYPCV